MSRRSRPSDAGEKSKLQLERERQIKTWTPKDPDSGGKEPQNKPGISESPHRSYENSSKSPNDGDGVSSGGSRSDGSQNNSDRPSLPPSRGSTSDGRGRADHKAQGHDRGGDRRGSAQPGPKADTSTSKNAVTANEKRYAAQAAKQTPNKGSTGYTDKELKAKPAENTRSSWQVSRGQHTKSAEKAARQEVKDAKEGFKNSKPGTDTKPNSGMKPPPGRSASSDKVGSNEPGKKIEHHHHAGIKQSRDVALRPKVAGEKGRITAVHASKKKGVYGDYGGKRGTHHTTAARIDKYEQARTARAMGRKGDSPTLPKNADGRRGLVDASGTSKWRWPETANQAARAKQHWDGAVPNLGPRNQPVNDRGEVVGSKADGATAKLEKAEAKSGTKAPAGQAERAFTGIKGDPATESPHTSKPETTASKGHTAERPGHKEPGVEASKMPKGESAVPKGGKLETPGTPKGEPGLLGKAGALAGLGEVFIAVLDVKRELAHQAPERMVEGWTANLTRPGDVIPWMREPTGYTVEKVGGEVIYRNHNGDQVPKEEAVRASQPTTERADWS